VDLRTYWSEELPSIDQLDLAVLEEDLAIPLRLMHRSDESTIGHRILRQGHEGTAAVLCVRRSFDSGALSIDLASSLEDDSVEEWEDERIRTRAAIARAAVSDTAMASLGRPIPIHVPVPTVNELTELVSAAARLESVEQPAALLVATAYARHAAREQAHRRLAELGAQYQRERARLDSEAAELLVRMEHVQQRLHGARPRVDLGGLSESRSLVIAAVFVPLAAALQVFIAQLWLEELFSHGRATFVAVGYGITSTLSAVSVGVLGRDQLTAAATRRVESSPDPAWSARHRLSFVMTVLFALLAFLMPLVVTIVNTTTASRVLGILGVALLAQAGLVTFYTRGAQVGAAGETRHLRLLLHHLERRRAQLQVRRHGAAGDFERRVETLVSEVREAEELYTTTARVSGVPIDDEREFRVPAWVVDLISSSKA
jgi:hypothetical protein